MNSHATLLLLLVVVVAAQIFSSITIVVTTLPNVLVTSQWITVTTTKLGHTITYSELYKTGYISDETSTYTIAATASITTMSSFIDSSVAPSHATPPATFSTSSLVATITPTSSSLSGTLPAFSIPPALPNILSPVATLKLPTSAIVGLAIGSLALFAMTVIGLLYCVYRVRSRQVLFTPGNVPLSGITQGADGTWRNTESGYATMSNPLDVSRIGAYRNSLSFFFRNPRIGLPGTHQSPTAADNTPSQNILLDTKNTLRSVSYPRKRSASASDIEAGPSGAPQRPPRPDQKIGLKRSERIDFTQYQDTDDASVSSFNTAKKIRQRQAALAQLEGRPITEGTYTPSVYSREEDDGMAPQGGGIGRREGSHDLLEDHTGGNNFF